VIALRVAVGLGVGLVLGAGAVVWLRASPSAVSAPDSGQIDLARCPERVAVAREAEALRERHRVAQELLRGLRATEIELIGEPPPWPEALPPELRPDQARATVERAFEGTRYRIEGIDCEEFPCIVATSWDVEPEDTDDHLAPSRKLSAEELEDKGVDTQQIQVSFWEVDEGGAGMDEWSALAPQELVEGVPRDRLQHRRRSLEALWTELAEHAEGSE